MNLRDQASADARAILEDDVRGFGCEITLTDPDDVRQTVKGFTTDISESIDPETGQIVMGRTASVALPLAALAAVGLGIPVGVAEPTRRPWVVQFNDVAGVAHVFKVREGRPDRAAGVVVCLLEHYRP